MGAGAGEKAQNAGTCWRTATLRGASTSSVPGPSMLLLVAAENKVRAGARVLRGRGGRCRGRAASWGGSDSSSAVLAALRSTGRGQGMSWRPWALRWGRRGKGHTPPGPEHDEIAA